MSGWAISRRYNYHGSMPLGPIIIFDKSFLQSLNVDEAVWLDNFFLTVITPLFFVETLADLERKSTAAERRSRWSEASHTRPPICSRT